MSGRAGSKAGASTGASSGPASASLAAASLAGARLAHPHGVAPVDNSKRTPRHAEPETRHHTARLGMWIFLASEVLFFGALIVAYAIARLHSPEGFAAASVKTNVWLGTSNTAILLVSSCQMAIAAEASECARPRDVSPRLYAAALLGVAFLCIKGFEYHEEWMEGLFPGPGFNIDGRVVPGAELFFAWYFFATALHALHLAIGIALVLGFAWVRRSKDADVASRAGAPRLHVIALYWHFVDVVWIVLYPLIYLVAPRT